MIVSNWKQKGNSVFNKGKYWHPDCDAAFNRQPPPPPPVPDLDIESLLGPLQKTESKPVMAPPPPPPKPKGPDCFGCSKPIEDVSFDFSIEIPPLSVCARPCKKFLICFRFGSALQPFQLRSPSIIRCLFDLFWPLVLANNRWCTIAAAITFWFKPRISNGFVLETNPFYSLIILFNWSTIQSLSVKKRDHFDQFG